MSVVCKGMSVGFKVASDTCTAKSGLRMQSGLVVYASDVSDWLVLNESLHGFVAGQSQMVVQRCRSAVAVFTALPEEPFVIAQERSTLHLRLMLQDGVSFGTQLFWT